MAILTAISGITMVLCLLLVFETTWFSWF